MTQLEQYRRKTDAQLQYICKDANEAAQAMRSIGDFQNECKYLDQVNDASTVIFERRMAVAKALKGMVAYG